MKHSLTEHITDRVMAFITESLQDDMANGNVTPLKGRRATRLKTRIGRIFRLVRKYRIDLRTYTDRNWKALDDYRSVISSLGGDMTCWPDEAVSGENTCVFGVSVEYDDGMKITGYIKMIGSGPDEDPFSSYTTCIVLWPK